MLDISHNNEEKKEGFQIIIYSNENGEMPFVDYLMGLPPKMKTKVLWAIELLKEKGTELREPYSSPLGYGLFELRIKFGSDIVRCLYFYHKEQIVILTNGFTKKTDKTPRKEEEWKMTFEELKDLVLSDPDVKREYDALEPEFQLILALLELRNEQNISQQELAERSGINRSDISRIEHGNANPSLKTMKRLAGAFGKKVHISFV